MASQNEQEKTIKDRQQLIGFLPLRLGAFYCPAESSEQL